MKKLIFSFSFIILLCLVFTCKPFMPGDFSGGGSGASFPKSVTVYLDGNAPPPSARALSRDLAETVCDYFEVIFLYNYGGVPWEARGAWRALQTAGVSGVFRDVPVDYGGVSATLAPDSGFGSAILLAGRSDKTLLAIGHLYEVDDVPGTIIDSNTTRVTFALDALTSSVNNSFLTAAGDDGPGGYQNVSPGNTVAYNENIAGRSFRLFRLEPNEPSTKAEYTVGLHSAGDFSEYKDGLFVAAAGVIEKKQPRYTLPNGNIQTEITLIQDERTVVSMLNNQTPDAPFAETIEIDFDTRGAVNGSMFSFVYSIPVYALVPGSSWYIRPGYGTYLYDLDNGRETGGAVLIVTGDIDLDPGNGRKLVVVRPPDKWKYEKNGNREFDISGLVVELQTLEGNTVTPPSPIPHSELKFRLGLWFIPDPNPSPWAFGNEWYGCQEVIVEYVGVNGRTYYGDVEPNSATFFILIGGADSDFVDPINYFHVGVPGSNNPADDTARSNQFNGIINGLAPANQTSVIIVHGNFNIKDQPNGPNPRLIFVVAAAPNIMIGREDNNVQIIHYYTPASRCAYYFGVWPYIDPLNDGIQNWATYPYTIYAGGRYETLPIPLPAIDPPPTYTKKLLVDGTTQVGGITNVRTNAGVRIINPNLFN
jgi:hypothetical protein